MVMVIAKVQLTSNRTIRHKVLPSKLSDKQEFTLNSKRRRLVTIQTFQHILTSIKTSKCPRKRANNSYELSCFGFRLHNRMSDYVRPHNQLQFTRYSTSYPPQQLSSGLKRMTFLNLRQLVPVCWIFLSCLLINIQLIRNKTCNTLNFYTFVIVCSFMYFPDG